MKVCFLTKSTALYALLILFVCCSPLLADAAKSSEVARADSIQWIKYDQGMERAKAEDKPIVVFFWRSSCGYCRKIAASAFKDTSVIRYVNENAVPVSVNTQSQGLVKFGGKEIPENELASKEWLVRSVPCIWLLDSGGCRIRKLTGLRACSGVATSLKDILAHPEVPCPNAPLTQPKADGKTESTKKP